MSSTLPVFVFVFAIVLSACGTGGSDGPPGSGAGGPAAFPATEVKTIALEEKAVPNSSEYVATVRSLRSTTVQPQVDGLVRQIFVRAVQRVQAGQPIMQIDPDRQQATVTTTESQRLAREADLEFAKQQLARMQKLYEGGAVSRADLEQAESTHKNAAAQLAAVQSQIRENQVELQYYRVTAP